LIEFGRNANQLSHTFRHTYAAGLTQSDVEQEITKHLQLLQDRLMAGPYTGEVHVRGVHLEFRAFRFDDGNIHVGRITVR